MALPARFSCFIAAALLGACSSEPPRGAPVNPRTEVAEVSSAARGKAAEGASEGQGQKAAPPAASAKEAQPAREEAAPLAVESYPWLSDRSLKLPEAKEPL